MSSGDEPLLLPLFLKLDGREVLVVGGGAVAERKIAALVEARASVRVVSPEATEGVQRAAADGAIRWERRAFAEADAEGAWLVFAATSDAAVQRAAAEAAKARRVFCVAVDDPPNASAYSGAVVRRPPFLVAISSQGATPALTRLLREVIEHVLPGEAWIDRAKELRARWLADGTPMGERFPELVREMTRRDG
jgi:siroheme synthase-like protein